MVEESKLMSIVEDINNAMCDWMTERKDISGVSVGINQNHYVTIVVRSSTFSLDILNKDNIESILPKIVCDNAEKIIITVEPACYIRLC
jgi:hypothetical protein